MPDTTATIAYVNPDHLAELRALGQDVVLGGEKNRALVKRTFVQKSVRIYDGRQQTGISLAKNGFVLCRSPFAGRAPKINDYEDEEEMIDKICKPRPTPSLRKQSV
jgi:hypothetical protein